MNVPEQELPVAYLKPGEMYFFGQPTLVMTVLGSCLSVTMFHRPTGVGAICHGLLPHCRGHKRCNGECLEGFKYVDCSILRMLEQFDARGITRSEIEVKCFGGADMFSRDIKNLAGLASIGEQNVRMAEKIITQEGLGIRIMDVGGLQGRKLLFYTHTGQVFLKRLERTGATRREQPTSAT